MSILPDFSWVSWTAQDIETKLTSALETKRQAYATLKAVPDNERTFANTPYAIESSNYTLSDLISALEVLLNMHPDQVIRSAARSAIEQYQKDIVDIEYDEAVYAALKIYAEKPETLPADAQKLLADMLRDYRRMGFDLPPAQREQLKTNIKKLGDLEIAFSNNINEYQDHISVATDETQGLPQSYLDQLKKDDHGNYIVTLDYPDYFPFMKNAKNEAKREELIRKNLHKGGDRNITILKEVLDLREQNAKLLGYENHAAYVLEERMAKNSQTANAFLADLLSKAQAGYARELQELSALKQQETGKSELAFYDRLYYYEQLRKSKFNLDTELVREYFPTAHVTEKIFEIYATLFSVTFVPAEGLPVWHPDVSWYEVRNLDGTSLAYFAFDLHPRDNKYGHAAVFPISLSREFTLGSGNFQKPLCALVCNFPKQTGSQPSLIGHDDVETFFHEFGHVMHALLSKSRFLSQSSFNVPRDFVEAPSQMLEGWVWEKSILKQLSKHYKTGQALPDELIDTMIAARFIDAANFVVGQVTQAQFDMQLHTGTGTSDPAALHRSLVAQNTHIPLPEDAIWPAGFGHLMGYDAGYYGYMWSKVYAADMFTRFRSEGLLNSQTGMDYRKQVLEKGHTEEELNLVKAFLKRDPDTQAFFENLGLL